MADTFLPHEDMMMQNIEPTTIYNTETCWKHSREFPAWLMRCPDCEAEEKRAAMAAHYSQKRREGYSASYQDADEPDLTQEEVADWNRWLKEAITTVLLLVLLFCLWMSAQNRHIASEQSQQAQEGQR